MRSNDRCGSTGPVKIFASQSGTPANDVHFQPMSDEGIVVA